MLTDLKNPSTCTTCNGYGCIRVGVNDAYGVYYDEEICPVCKGLGVTYKYSALDLLTPIETKTKCKQT